ncbi:unnamed protein product [Meloidogyne enterolobii]|uniref:Uncharacterized protein n=1 Tax=Meloidogyne enterolobii TaxID=390850 RepID=A0ACB1AYT3_MELEN
MYFLFFRIVFCLCFCLCFLQQKQNCVLLCFCFGVSELVFVSVFSELCLYCVFFFFIRINSMFQFSELFFVFSGFRTTLLLKNVFSYFRIMFVFSFFLQ